MIKTSKRIKYTSPKILLMDTSPDIQEALAKKGFDTAQGSFGISLTNISTPVMATTNEIMPFDWRDRWLAIVQLEPEHYGAEPKATPLPNRSFLSQMPDEHLVIDPRPIAMSLYSSDFDRIVANGGIIVCFAAPRKTITLFDRTTRFPTQRPSYQGWGFTEWLNSRYLTVREATGQDMSLVREIEKSSWGRLLKRYVGGSRFLTTFGPTCNLEPKANFVPLLRNKFDDTVGAILKPNKDGEKGFILILPQLKDKGEFLTELLTEILPDWAPDLFPELVSGRWLTNLEYEIPEVSSLRTEIQRIRQTALQEVDEIEKRIQFEREKWGYLHELLRGTGDDLVDAVENTLNLIGFTKTTNVDKEIAAGREAIQKREDLRIEVKSRPELVVEVRGISNLPSDEDCMGAEKHVYPRAKERGDFLVKGLTVINHERHLPPMERQNGKVFRGEVITNSIERQIGLVTTWNLYRLARSYLKLGWSHDQIEDSFYQSGPILPVPNHYEELGKLGKVFVRPAGTILGIELTDGEIMVGDRIAVELDNEFEEQPVESLKIKDQSVDKASAGDQVGVLTEIAREHLRNGMRVFKVLSTGTISCTP